MALRPSMSLGSDRSDPGDYRTPVRHPSLGMFLAVHQFPPFLFLLFEINHVGFANLCSHCIVKLA